MSDSQIGLREDTEIRVLPRGKSEFIIYPNYEAYVSDAGAVPFHKAHLVSMTHQDTHLYEDKIRVQIVHYGAVSDVFWNWRAHPDVSGLKHGSANAYRNYPTTNYGLIPARLEQLGYGVDSAIFQAVCKNLEEMIRQSGKE